MYNGINSHTGSRGQRHTTLLPVLRMEVLEVEAGAFRRGPQVRPVHLARHRVLQALQVHHRVRPVHLAHRRVLQVEALGAADHQVLQEIRRSAQKESQIVDA
ncbi:hypothetical protein [Halobacillus sp. Cin3]|uniref:hypothetical protein n=1 Tax=Halobacillus sp. Cin3 TaxID=2928441 RepID=UPI0032B11813